MELFRLNTSLSAPPFPVTADWEEEAVATFKVFRSHKWIEPGATIEDQLLIGIPLNTTFPLRLDLRLVDSLKKKTVTRTTATTLIEADPASSRESVQRPDR